MNTDRKQTPDIGVDRPEKSFPVLLGCLVALLALESLALVALVIWLGVQAAEATASDVASGIALLIIAALCALWLVLTTVAAARRRSWMRASVITWHLLVLAIAVGCFTGITAVPQAGWVLLVLAAVGIGLVVAPQVTRATARESAPAEDSKDSEAPAESASSPDGKKD
ncbi:hypothetical protein GCM10027414_07280 [Humibacter ginsengiterrae]